MSFRIQQLFYVMDELLIQQSFLSYSRTSGGRGHRAWAGKQTSARGGVTPHFLFCDGDVVPKKTHLCEWMKLSEGDFLKKYLYSGH